MEAQVTAVSDSEWSTEITIDGTYDGPTDFVAIEEYKLVWTTDGKQIQEEGTATLISSSGEPVRNVWSSIITPESSFDTLEVNLNNFLSAGELVSISISPFEFEENSMTYEWEGTVEELTEQNLN